MSKCDREKSLYEPLQPWAWNKQSANIRDTVDSGFDIKIKSTSHLLHLIHSNQLPDKVFFNIHPQRWFNPGFSWAKELVWQGVKNGVKAVMVRSGRGGEGESGRW